MCGCRSSPAVTITTDAASAQPVIAPDAVIIDLGRYPTAGFGSHPRAVLCEVCTFSVCLCGFSPATLASSHHPLTRVLLATFNGPQL